MSVLERKLRPIYEALDSRNAKTALKLINAALPKHKDDQLLRVLKGLALIRLGKSNEACQACCRCACDAMQSVTESADELADVPGVPLDIPNSGEPAAQACDSVVEEAPTDEQVLNILGMVYKGPEQACKLIAAYEKAVEAFPERRQLLQVLLFAQTRALQFGKAQQTAMTLHRLKGHKSIDYQWWIITCLVLQARRAGPEEAAKGGQQLLMLARGMAKKRVENPEAAKQYTGGYPESAEAIRLYLEVLKDLKDTEEIGKFLDGPLAGRIHSSDVERLLDLNGSLVERGHTEQAAHSMKELAQQHGSGSWEVLQAYLNLVLPLPSAEPDSGTHLDNELSQHAADGVEHKTNGVSSPASTSFEAVREAEGLLRKLQQAALESGIPAAKSRAPLLAAVDLEHRKCLHGNEAGPSMKSRDVLSEEELERLESSKAAGPSGHEHGAHESATNGIAAAALVYFQKLGHLASCAADLRKYTAQIQGQGRRWLASELHRICDITDKESSLQDLTSVQRRVSAHLIEHDLDLPHFETSAEAEKHAANLMKVFRSAAELQKNLDQKERGIADALVALAVIALLTAWKLEAEPKPPTYLLKAILVLKAAQISRRRSAPIYLAAMTLYGLLGAATSAMDSYDALDIKHIQNDTLSGHLVLPIMLAALCEEGEAHLLEDARALYEHHERDAGDTILMAFKAGNWTKVLEFVKFKERLAASHARAVAYAETAVHNLTSLRAPTPVSTLEAASAAADSLKSALPSGFAGLRFNEDLSTRPAWLRPYSGSSQLAVPFWWEQSASLPSSGYGRCWWAKPLAAEGTFREAQQHRKHCIGHLELRSQLPTLLEAAVSPEHGSAAATLKGCLKRRSNVKAAARDSSDSSCEQKTGLKLLQSLSSPIFSAAAAMQAALATSEERAEEATQQASQQLQALRSHLDALTGVLERDLQATSKQEVATGASMFVAAAFANEEALWLALCLQAWRQPKQTKKGRKGPEVLSSFSNAAGVIKTLAPDLEGLQEALQRGVKALLEQLDVFAKRRSQDLVERLCSSLFGTGDLSLQLWGWEDQLDVNQTISGLVREQSEFVMALQMKLRKIQQLL